MVRLQMLRPSLAHIELTLDNNGLHSVWIWICSAEEHAAPSYELSQEGLEHPRGYHADNYKGRLLSASAL